MCWVLLHVATPWVYASVPHLLLPWLVLSLLADTTMLCSLLTVVVGDGLLYIVWAWAVVVSVGGEHGIRGWDEDEDEDEDER